MAARRGLVICTKCFILPHFNLLIFIFVFLNIVIDIYPGTISNTFAATRLQNQNDLRDYIRVLIGQGIALSNAGKYKEAISYYDKTLFLDPHNVYALNNKGLAIASLGNYTETIKYYDKVLAITPNDIDTLYSKAVALDKTHNHKEAIKYYDKVLVMNPKYISNIAKRK